MSLWLVLFLVSCLLTFRQVRAVGFDGIPGEYCSTRTSKCCPDRDDQCSAPILDNHLCYCDMFCNRSNGNDCCPDFKAVCGSETPEAVSGELMPFQSFNSFIVCSSILLIYKASDGWTYTLTRARKKRTAALCAHAKCVQKQRMAMRAFNMPYSRGHPEEGKRRQIHVSFVCVQKQRMAMRAFNMPYSRGHPEEGKRRQIHVANDPIDTFGSSGKWSARNYSNFWGRTLEDGMRYRLGTLFPDKSVQNMNEILMKPRELPSSFDAREKWPLYIHPVRDQGDCARSAIRFH
uniref:SMB domain-containing protein n=1 Tax=Ascaris lumbricoides TaxID=6252 RepID=A0A9J2PZU5_ASCLU